MLSTQTWQRVEQEVVGRDDNKHNQNLSSAYHAVIYMADLIVSQQLYKEVLLIS